MPRPAFRSLALLLTASVAAAGCSEGGAGARPDGSDASADAASARPPVPQAEGLTEPGSELRLGDAATVSWQPTSSLTGVAEITVEAVREQRPAVFRGWLRDEAARESRPYFVDVVVANEGDADLGGQQLPLYLLDDQDRLAAPWTMGGDFDACQSGPLPEPFDAGEDARLCLVYLVPQGGTARGVVFQPSESFEPILWTGRVQRPGGA